MTVSPYVILRTTRLLTEEINNHKRDFIDLKIKIVRCPLLRRVREHVLNEIINDTFSSWGGIVSVLHQILLQFQETALKVTFVYVLGIDFADRIKFSVQFFLCGNLKFVSISIPLQDNSPLERNTFWAKCDDRL